jgi:alanyl-tRNA synthetase
MTDPQQNSPANTAAFSAAVTDIRLESHEGATARWQMTLSRTHFTAGDTGILEAVARSGTRIEIPVLAVLEEDGDIWHIVEKPLAGGTDVTGRVTR